MDLRKGGRVISYLRLIAILNLSQLLWCLMLTIPQIATTAMRKALPGQGNNTGAVRGGINQLTTQGQRNQSSHAASNSANTLLKLWHVPMVWYACANHLPTYHASH